MAFDIDFSIGASGVGKLDKQIGGLGRTMKTVGGIFIAALGSAAIGSFVNGGFEIAAAYEQTTIQFEQFTGSAKAAKEQLEGISDFAASTPFQFQELADSGRKLLAFNLESEKLIPTLRSIGDIAAGTGNSVSELAELYGKAKVQGRLFGEDINQLTGRGIPIIQELAKQLGVAESQIKKMVSEGKVGFPEIEKAFANMTGEGGKFFGLTEKLAESTTGRLSTLKDNISLLQREIGEKLLPIASKAFNDITVSIRRVFFAEKDLEGGSRALDQAFHILASVFEQVKIIGGSLVDTFNAIRVAVSGVFDALDSFLPSVKTTEKELATLLNTTVGAQSQASFDALAKKLGVNTVVMDNFRDSVKGFNFAAIPLKDLLPTVEKMFNEWAGSLNETSGNAKALSDVLGGGGESGAGTVAGSAEFAAGSIGALQEQIGLLNEQILGTTNESGIPKLLEQIEFLEAKTALMKEGGIGFIPATFEENTLTAQNSLQGITAGFDTALTKAELFGERMAIVSSDISEGMAGVKAQVTDTFLNSFPNAIAAAVSGTETLGVAMAKLAVELGALALREAGMVLIRSAGSPAAIASFPANIPLLIGGLALLGLSGAVTGLGAGIGGGGSGGPASLAPSPETATGGGGVPAGIGASSFGQEAFEFKPVINVGVSIGQDELDDVIVNSLDRRANAFGR